MSKSLSDPFLRHFQVSAKMHVCVIAGRTFDCWCFGSTLSQTKVMMGGAASFAGVTLCGLRGRLLRHEAEAAEGEDDLSPKGQ